MRLRGRKRVVATVSLQPDPPAILFGFGAFTIESSIEDALAFGHQLADAIEEARRPSGGECS
jgi:hypothetical protein